MNRTALKNYAPIARREFIQAMTDRAAHYGINISKVEPLVLRGDSVVIGGRQFPQAVAAKRTTLEKRIQTDGFINTMEAIAYTWFNRLVALRYMELHGYLEHGYRVLSHPEGKSAPEVLEHAEHLELPGLQQSVVIDLKIAGDKEENLYRLILLAQCHALHEAMPFLFEKIDDETELLLPDNLLNSDSLMRKLVGEIEEEDWNEVEIIGWLYQFYISEKKDQVIGRVVASEDIPAATQLFTPNWIVKYLVQNTLGRQWLATYPQSPLRQQMEYYIEPAEQTPEVQEQLKAITPTSLNPEELTLLDPACGSGHILVEAYDLFKAIYKERGYQAKGIPGLILQKNLFGLEIDDRAAQLAAFALMMKARADDRRIFESEAKPNIVAFVDSQGMKASEIYFVLTSPLKGEKEGELESPAHTGHLFEPDDNLFTRAEAAKAAASRTPTTVNFSQADIAALLELFENAKTFGSLIQIPPKLAAKLPEIEKRLDDVLTHGDLTHASAHVLKPLLYQARLLAGRYDAVVANPPYMSSKYMNTMLKAFLKPRYEHSAIDLYSAFLYRATSHAASLGRVAMITMHGWMFLSTFEPFRKFIIDSTTVESLIHLGPRAFGTISGEVVQTAAVSLINRPLPLLEPVFCRLVEGEEEEKQRQLIEKRNRVTGIRQEEFSCFPGNQLSYWVSNAVRTAFVNGVPLSELGKPCKGLDTGNNARFVRLWHEVAHTTIGFGIKSRAEGSRSGKQWFPYNKGGTFRKWYGNRTHLVNWKNDGDAIRNFADDEGVIRSYVRNDNFYFRPSITWSDLVSSSFGARASGDGFLFDNSGPSIFPNEPHFDFVLGLLCSKPAFDFLTVINPTLHFQVGNIAVLPVIESQLARMSEEVSQIARSAVIKARQDWDSFETSWDFQCLPVRQHKSDSLQQSQAAADSECCIRFTEMKELEERNNRLFIDAYGLQDELSPEVPDNQITLYRPNRAEDIKRLLSYAIGCMMGRYSLDKPGLIYANSGNEGFDFSQYSTFPADDDGIVPLLETDWGIHDDATNRFVEFISVAWPKEHVEENLKFVAESLDPDSKESSREVIRHYLATGFFAHHLQMYKRRPIYWLFSSGRRKAFQALVYLHRYNEGTLARMRTEYVIPLQGKIAATIEQLEGDKTKATSTSQRSAIERNLKAMKLQKEELVTFDGLLKNYADMRIKIDLDDGVKVNYAKFRDILAEVRAVTGGAEE